MTNEIALLDRWRDATTEVLGCLAAIAKNSEWPPGAAAGVAQVGIKEIHSRLVGENITPRSELEKQLTAALEENTALRAMLGAEGRLLPRQR